MLSSEKAIRFLGAVCLSVFLLCVALLPIQPRDADVTAMFFDAMLMCYLASCWSIVTEKSEKCS